MKYLSIMLGALVLTGCADPSPDSPRQLTSLLQRNYGTRPANEFFYDYGQAAGEFERVGGGRAYRWTSMRPDFRSVRQSYHSDEGDAKMTDNYTGIAAQHYCELRVYTDAEDTIQSFAVVVDSIGKWSASRCSEIFAPRN